MKRGMLFSTLLMVTIVGSILGHELCMDDTGPQDYTNTYCTEYSGKSCCDANAETSLRTRLENLKITDATCNAFMKKALCAECDPWGAHLFGVETQQNRIFPYLCAPTYCTDFYNACKDVTMTWASASANPFGANPISSKYQTADAFCNDFKPYNDFDSCYNGTKFVPAPPPPINDTDTPKICVEHFAPGNFGELQTVSLYSQPGSENLFVGYKVGIIKLHSASGQLVSTFLDIKSKVYNNGEAGFLAFALHPNYAQNGRVFVSYSCKNCSVPCQVDSDCNTPGATCPPATKICQGGDHTTLIEEYVRSSADANKADVTPVKTIFTTRQPYGNHNGGLITFGPDNLLYIFLGDGGSGNDPQNNAQNLNNYLGKVLRVDVDGTPAQGKNYAIPTSNPFVSNNNAKPEVFAFGLRNPWRASFDRMNSRYLFVGDVGQDAYEEVNLVSAGGNYGWRVREGLHDNPAVNDADIPSRIDPVFEYPHTSVGGGPSVIAGYVYRGDQDNCTYGRFLYADWESVFFHATETFPGSGTFQTRRIGLTCASDSSQTGCANVGNVFSYAEDAKGAVYILGSNRIVRMVNPARCSLTCTLPLVPQPTTGNPTTGSATTTSATTSPATTGGASTTSGETGLQNTNEISTVSTTDVWESSTADSTSEMTQNSSTYDSSDFDSEQDNTNNENYPENSNSLSQDGTTTSPGITDDQEESGASALIGVSLAVLGLLSVALAF